jgi:hypothetical protein
MPAGLQAVLVPPAEQLDRGREARIAVLGEYLNFDTIDSGQLDREGESGGRCHPHV